MKNIIWEDIEIEPPEMLYIYYILQKSIYFSIFFYFNARPYVETHNYQCIIYDLKIKKKCIIIKTNL